MGSAAVAIDLTGARRARGEPAACCGLAFDALGGPVVGVAGLVGGAGTSTLAFALARQAAIESRAPILLAEASASSGLAHVVGVRSPSSLFGLARLVADGEGPAATYTELAPGLRLVATSTAGCDDEVGDLRAVIAQAQAAHGLVVLDCGSGRRDLDRVIDQVGTVVWVVPASDVGVLAARAMFATTVPFGSAATEVLVARELPGVKRARVRTLSRACDARCERLALLKHQGAIAIHAGDIKSLTPTLSTIAPLVRRPQR